MQSSYSFPRWSPPGDGMLTSSTVGTLVETLALVLLGVVASVASDRDKKALLLLSKVLTAFVRNMIKTRWW